jgi:uncharacterized protein YjbI with pentapeptide repeats
MDQSQTATNPAEVKRDIKAIIAAFRRCEELGEPLDPSMLDLRGLSFLGHDLSRLDLSGCDFTGAELSRCNLRNSICAQAIFDKATFFQAKLDGAEFLLASFQNANLSECSAKNTGFGQCNVSEARFNMADLTGSTFVAAKAHNTDFRSCKLAKSRFMDADLSGADFSQSDLTEADLQQTNLTGTTFSKTILRAARLRSVKNFRTAYWIDADIREVDFAGAYLVRRHIVDENFLHEFRHQSPKHKMIYWVWWVTSDCGRSAFRWAAFCAVIVVTYGLIYKLLGNQIKYPDGLADFYAPWYVSIMLACCMAVDVLPKGTLAQIILNSEVVLGYVGFGGLLTIIATHLGTRGE